MKISLCIKRLQQIMEEYGDIDELALITVSEQRAHIMGSLARREVCDTYLRPSILMGGPCLTCGASQPEHASATNVDAVGQPTNDPIWTTRAYVSALRSKSWERPMTIEDAARLREALEEMVYQFGFACVKDGQPALCTGGLSALECAFEVLGWDEPYVIPDPVWCDAPVHPRCANRTTSGTPTPDGYKRFCHEHFHFWQEAQTHTKAEGR